MISISQTKQQEISHYTQQYIPNKHLKFPRPRMASSAPWEGNEKGEWERKNTVQTFTKSLTTLSGQRTRILMRLRWFWEGWMRRVDEKGEWEGWMRRVNEMRDSTWNSIMLRMSYLSSSFSCFTVMDVWSEKGGWEGWMVFVGFCESFYLYSCGYFCVEFCVIFVYDWGC